MSSVPGGAGLMCVGGGPSSFGAAALPREPPTRDPRLTDSHQILEDDSAVAAGRRHLA